MGIKERQGGQPIGRERRAGVKAEPTEPQKAGPGPSPGDVVRVMTDFGIAKARTYDIGGDQGRKTRRQVDDGTTREIESPEAGEPTPWAPDPVGHRIVDQEAP